MRHPIGYGIALLADRLRDSGWTLARKLGVPVVAARLDWPRITDASDPRLPRLRIAQRLIDAGNAIDAVPPTRSAVVILFPATARSAASRAIERMRREREPRVGDVYRTDRKRQSPGWRGSDS